jgi:acetylornithine deacetylase/succinyl-diaminopimelate desuccinylase-like protein
MPDPHLEALLSCLRFPSVSTDPDHRADVRACASWLVGQLSDGGFQATLHETPGHPVIIAKGPFQPGRPRVVIYGHYDVQPADPIELWTKTPDPFSPVIIDEVIYARGATDNKGQLMAHLRGALALLAAERDLPVNLTFLFEGEEEVGSPSLAPFLHQHRDELACDVIAVSDTGMVAPGLGTLTYGLRGIAAIELTVHGPAQDLHSGVWGGTVRNPASALSHLLASLHQPDGSIAVEGFYEGVTPLASWEREAWAKLPGGDADTLALTGSSELFGEPGYSALERRWARPTAEINGLTSGFQGKGSKTIIPAKASAKLTFRLVPGQDPDHIQQLVINHFQRYLPSGLSLELHAGHTGSPYQLDPHGPFGKAAQLALADTFSQPPALIREGGSIPIVQSFREILGVDTLLLGLALPDCNIHAPDENFPVANFNAGIQLHANLLRRIAQV